MAKNGNIHPTRIFKNPDELEHAFELYKKDVVLQAKEWQKVQYVGRNGERMSDNIKLPFIYEGFLVFCKENFGVVHQYFDNKQGYYDDFVGVCKDIKIEITANQITGGMIGVFNTSITQRLNGIKDTIEQIIPDKPKKITIKIKRDENNNS